jgi:hypothetical protein
VLTRSQRGSSAAAAPAAAAAAKAMEEILDDIVVVLELEAWSVFWFLVVLALWQASYRQSTGHNKKCQLKRQKSLLVLDAA